MVSSSHEAMHRIFQKDPGVFGRTFRTLGLSFPEPVGVALMPTDLTETEPLERRVDTLLHMETADGGGYLLAVESQSTKSAHKPPSWCYYASYLHAKYRLPVELVVTCQDEATARWASGPFKVGLDPWPLITMRPLVLGPHNVPVVATEEEVARDVPLAVFSAITHAKSPDIADILERLAAGLKAVDDETATVFTEFTELGLGKFPAADIWRRMMTLPLSYFRSETSMRLRREGREEGLSEGRVQKAVEDVLRILERRGIEVSEPVRQRVEACRDLGQLDAWFDRALVVSTAEELFEGEPAGPTAP
ncbi:hypothetical protein [Streptomyces sp. NPDC046939]|uniref:hypothetical protein n=1 Tax=Streptomyces sp. NPDC046939 TaxID=3155376 RepID=UPI0033E8645D